MMFGAWGNTDHDECIRIVHRALDGGINFIDTADVYSAGESEEIVAKALAGGRRDDVVLATKVHSTMGDDPNRRGNSRRWITTECEASLRRLGTDHIDLYQIHRPDPTCAIDETLGALTDLVRAGKIRYFGSSTFPAHEIVEAQWVARAPRPGAFRHRTAAVLDPRACGRERRPAGLPRLRHRGHSLESPRRGLALRGLWRWQAQHEPPVDTGPEALRPVAPGEPAETRGRLRTRSSGRRGRSQPHRARDGLRA